MCESHSKQVSGFVFMPSDLHIHTHFFQTTLLGCMQHNKVFDCGNDDVATKLEKFKIFNISCNHNGGVNLIGKRNSN